MSSPGGRLRVLAVGREVKTTPEAALFDRYAMRIKPKLDLLALPDGTGAPAEIRRREAEAMLKRLAASDFVVALDQDGDAPASADLAGLLTKWRETGRPVSFVIGGAEGLDRSVIDRANAILSLGRLTLPHMLARVLLAEQIYRAQCIITGHPYHRRQRP